MMIYEDMLEPKHNSNSENIVRLYSSTSVDREFYDLLWPFFVNFLAAMHFGSVYTIYEFLDNTYLLDVLGEEGVKAAEQCLEHIANAGLLPIEVDGQQSLYKYRSARLRHPSHHGSDYQSYCERTQGIAAG